MSAEAVVAPRPSPLSAGSLLGRVGELLGFVLRPVASEPVPVLHHGAAAPLEPGVPFRVMSWNLQFAGTRKHKFFYDGGPAVHVADADCVEALDAIGAELRATSPDIALLQEVDRDSDRTGRRDELAALLARAPYPRWASATYHRSRFVPVPPKNPLGRIDLHVAVLSRYAITAATRRSLPLLREPRLRRAFNLKRCILDVQVAVKGWDRPLHVAVTHLSAFSRGDGTLVAQVAVLREWMETRARAGDAFVLAGDLNLLPPGDDPARLGAEAAEYADRPNPIEQLLPRFRSVIPPQRLLDPANNTYLPWGAVVADRVLDYMFVSDGIEVVEARPLSRPDPVSDHLPLLATLRLVQPPEPTP
jgi:endonuclease/exonuclease/phosphatase family metal-dependent hydrolase